MLEHFVEISLGLSGIEDDRPDLEEGLFECHNCVGSRVIKQTD